MRSGFSESYLSESESQIVLFPNFKFSLHALSSLSSLMSRPDAERNMGAGHGKRTTKVSLLAAVLEVDGPDVVRLKMGAEAGTEVALLKLIVGDDSGAIVKITAWRETAELWSGSDEANHPGIKKGDVVCFKSERSSVFLFFFFFFLISATSLQIFCSARLHQRCQRSPGHLSSSQVTKFVIVHFQWFLQIDVSYQTCDWDKVMLPFVELWK